MAIVIPEVFADAVNEKLDVSLRVARLASDYTDLVADITTYGDTLHFPVIDRISDAEVVERGGELTPEEMSMTDSEATIKTVGKSTRIYDQDSVQVKGNVQDRLAEQLGEAMAKAVDSDLVAEIVDNAVYTEDVTSSDDLETVFNGAFEVFGDDVDNDTFAGIIINSKLRKYIVAMDSFMDGTKTNAAMGNGVVLNGQIGLWNGTIPVILSDNGTYTDSKAMFAIVKKDALGTVWQKQPTIEEEREAKKLATDLVASEMYAVKLLHTDGVSVVDVTIE
ncbi:MAG: hypothetical protein LUC88_08885 [Prevotella sp.]|nr:hypothetical protein [Prevotella sp.]